MRTHLGVIVAALIMAGALSVGAQSAPPPGPPTATDRWCTIIKDQRDRYEYRIAQLTVDLENAKAELALVKKSMPAKPEKKP